MHEWSPTASVATLRHRARMLQSAREFFAARGVLEVETPLLSAAAVSDSQIESLETRVAGYGHGFFLSTSPEFPMKRLLAAGSGDIYQICKVFRDGEVGRWHNPEFTMIEWYRLGMDDDALMTEVEALAAALMAPHRNLRPAERLTYAQVLREHAGVDVHLGTDSSFAAAAATFGIDCRAELDRDAKLDLLMGVRVGPKLGWERPCFVCDYPASQASLARLKPGVPAVAARFELYVDGIELANGFEELANAAEQRSRFEGDLQRRAARALRQRPLDVRLLAALQAGMPECAGVALGFDRLVAVALGTPGLADVLAFSLERA